MKIKHLASTYTLSFLLLLLTSPIALAAVSESCDGLINPSCIRGSDQGSVAEAHKSNYRNEIKPRYMRYKTEYESFVTKLKLFETHSIDALVGRFTLVHLRMKKWQATDALSFAATFGSNKVSEVYDNFLDVSKKQLESEYYKVQKNIANAYFRGNASLYKSIKYHFWYKSYWPFWGGSGKWGGVSGMYDRQAVSTPTDIFSFFKTASAKDHDYQQTQESFSDRWNNANLSPTTTYPKSVAYYKFSPTLVSTLWPQLKLMPAENIKLLVAQETLEDTKFGVLSVNLSNIKSLLLTENHTITTSMRKAVQFSSGLYLNSFSDHVTKIKSLLMLTCLKINAAGEPTLGVSCGKTDRSMDWGVHKFDSDKFMFRNMQTKTCLAVKQNEDSVTMAVCDQTDKAQRWHRTQHGYLYSMKNYKTIVPSEQKKDSAIEMIANPSIRMNDRYGYGLATWTFKIPPDVEPAISADSYRSPHGKKFIRNFLEIAYRLIQKEKFDQSAHARNLFNQIRDEFDWFAGLPNPIQKIMNLVLDDGKSVAEAFSATLTGKNMSVPTWKAFEDELYDPPSSNISNGGNFACRMTYKTGMHIGTYNTYNDSCEISWGGYTIARGGRHEMLMVNNEVDFLWVKPDKIHEGWQTFVGGYNWHYNAQKDTGDEPQEVCRVIKNNVTYYGKSNLKMCHIPFQGQEFYTKIFDLLVVKKSEKPLISIYEILKRRIIQDFGVLAIENTHISTNPEVRVYDNPITNDSEIFISNPQGDLTQIATFPTNKKSNGYWYYAGTLGSKINIQALFKQLILNKQMSTVNDDTYVGKLLGNGNPQDGYDIFVSKFDGIATDGNAWDLPYKISDNEWEYIKRDDSGLFIAAGIVNQLNTSYFGLMQDFINIELQTQSVNPSISYQSGQPIEVPTYTSAILSSLQNIVPYGEHLHAIGDLSILPEFAFQGIEFKPYTSSQILRIQASNTRLLRIRLRTRFVNWYTERINELRRWSGVSSNTQIPGANELDPDAFQVPPSYRVFDRWSSGNWNPPIDFEDWREAYLNEFNGNYGRAVEHLSSLDLDAMIPTNIENANMVVNTSTLSAAFNEIPTTTSIMSALTVNLASGSILAAAILPFF